MVTLTYVHVPVSQNLTVLASDDNGQHFNRSLQITPPAPLNKSDPYAYPVPGAGYSQLQCGESLIEVLMSRLIYFTSKLQSSTRACSVACATYHPAGPKRT